ncbi:MAG: hypothetical protein JXB03_12380 [Spirochaetales bacterium]|nr:hypothetical protein [Spirochaetales bacterium]
MKRVLIIVCLIVSFYAAAQEPAVPAGAELPKGYLGVEVGLSLDEVKAALFAHPYLRFRGDPDVSLLKRTEERLIQCEGSGFVDRAAVQLKDNAVYLVSFLLNVEAIDYYSMYTALVEKYGEPASLSPTQAVWDDERIRMSLEKPLTVKYLDIAVFSGILDATQQEKSLNAAEREDFLESF